jgi:hypothetical protein
MLGSKFKCEYTVGEAIGQLVIWLILVILTFGLALFVLPYYFLKAPLNRTYVLDRDGNVISTDIPQVVCRLKARSPDFGH